MKINNYNNNQSFLFKPLKIVKTLGWAAVAVLALPTMVGSYLALKKAVEVWSNNDKPDTKKADAVASRALLKEDDEDYFVIEAPDKGYVEKTPQQEKETLYEDAIKQFKEPGCLRSRSAEAYLDYLKNTERNLGFHFDTSLLYNSGIKLDEFLTKIQAKIKEASSLSLTFVPFLLAGNLLHEQHIVVAVINKTSEQIEYFDPKGNQWYSMLGRLAERNLAQWSIPTQQFLEKLSQAIFPGIEPKIIRNINGPQPLLNKVDCGEHALDFIQARMNIDFIPSDQHPNYFETSLSSNGKQLREEMAFTLQAKLNKDNKISNTVILNRIRKKTLQISNTLNFSHRLC